jgi:phage terminase small subunit
LRPPPDLTPAEKEVFTAIVGAVDAKHFTPSDLPLLVSYATAIVTEREAVDHLRREGWVTPAGKASPWLVVKEKSHREMIALSLRLRLSPQGRGRLQVKPDRISAYERLELLEGDDDDDD